MLKSMEKIYVILIFFMSVISKGRGLTTSHPQNDASDFPNNNSISHNWDIKSSTTEETTTFVSHSTNECKHTRSGKEYTGTIALGQGSQRLEKKDQGYPCMKWSDLKIWKYMIRQNTK